MTPPPCPAVVLEPATATQAADGYQLSIVARGGTSFIYRWYDGITQIGAGNDLHVNPSVTTSIAIAYLCRAEAESMSPSFAAGRAPLLGSSA